MSEQKPGLRAMSRMLIEPDAVVMIRTIPIQLIDLVNAGTGGGLWTDDNLPFVGIRFVNEGECSNHYDYAHFPSIRQAKTAKALILKAIREAKR